MDGPRHDDIPRQSEGEKSSTEPHPRDGHVRLPNEVVEKLAQLEANGSQYRIIFAVWRRTLGWQKHGEWKNEPYPISLGDLAKATGLDRRQIIREVKDLTERNILKREPGRRKGLISFNLNYTTWVVVKLPPLKMTRGSGEATTRPSGEIDTTLVVKKTLPPDTKSKLLNKRINKQIKKQGGPTTDESRILDILRESKGWRYDEADDLAWLRDFTQEFPDFNLSEVRAARDYYSGRAPPKHKGGWKNRLRNWMRNKAEFGRKEKPGPRGKSFTQYMREQEGGS